MTTTKSFTSCAPYHRTASVGTNQNSINRIIQRVPANITYTEDHILIELAVPGFAKDQIDVSLEKNKLKIVGKQLAKEVPSHSSQKYRLKEFGIKDFEMQFVLGDQIDTEAIMANCDNGILKVTLNKKPKEQPEIKQIQIQ